MLLVFCVSFAAGSGVDSRSDASWSPLSAFVGMESWLFTMPFCVGEMVRVRSQIEELRARPRGTGQVNRRRELINQYDAVVQRGVFTNLVLHAASIANLPSPDWGRKAA